MVCHLAVHHWPNTSREAGQRFVLPRVLTSSSILTLHLRRPTKNLDFIRTLYTLP